MEKVIHSVKEKDEALRLPVLKMELDYQLMTLHDAIISQDAFAIEESKLCLAQLREEWIQMKE
ncbi:hypothetical protein [Alkalicoccobacillus murimartini]|uniref:Uncharacterized protein n=1 Tax=Alkalicoccobacillus murimartini TaxID=171685 RepID=A0ABT9YF72_9BACI|nr:hypothetical protein [Alkalicoccobacillus murimartini]MDQ0206493.1 hypothetical protein [Alkalicoccobacillus murimartini]